MVVGAVVGVAGVILPPVGGTATSTVVEVRPGTFGGYFIFLHFSFSVIFSVFLVIMFSLRVSL